MKFRLIYLFLLLISAPAMADSFTKGDPRIGKTLADKSCNTCHVSMFGGDGSKIYTRADRKVKNASQLLTRVRACNTNANTGWFPDEEMHVAAYLNLT